MDRRSKSSLLWGAVGALAFLVLVQGYQLAGGASITAPVVVGVTLLVGIVATGLSYLLEGRGGPNRSA